MPTLEERIQLLGKWTKKGETLIKEVAERTENYTRRDLFEVGKCLNDNVDNVLEKCPRSCTDEMLSEYNKWKEDFGYEFVLTTRLTILNSYLGSHQQ